MNVFSFLLFYIVVKCIYAKIYHLNHLKVIQLSGTKYIHNIVQSTHRDQESCPSGDSQSGEGVDLYVECPKA